MIRVQKIFLMLKSRTLTIIFFYFPWEKSAFVDYVQTWSFAGANSISSPHKWFFRNRFSLEEFVISKKKYKKFYSQFLSQWKDFDSWFGFITWYSISGVQFVISECKRVGESALKVKKLHTSIEYDIKRGALNFRVPVLEDVAVQGDVKIEFFKHKLKKVLNFVIVMIQLDEKYNFRFLSQECWKMNFFLFLLSIRFIQLLLKITCETPSYRFYFEKSDSLAHINFQNRAFKML